MTMFDLKKALWEYLRKPWTEVCFVDKASPEGAVSCMGRNLKTHRKVFFELGIDELQIEFATPHCVKADSNCYVMPEKLYPRVKEMLDPYAGVLTFKPDGKLFRCMDSTEPPEDYGPNFDFFKFCAWETEGYFGLADSDKLRVAKQKAADLEASLFKGKELK